ncbi:MAG: efflux RND transporter periplasmic adaptor subunit [Chitinophagales bacterium]
MMKGFRGLVWVSIILIVIILIKIFFIRNKTVSPSNAGKKMNVPAVNAIIIKPQVLNNISLLSGSLEANESVDLQPQVSGMITGLYFKEGDKVNKGTLLVKINDASLKAQLQKQQAALEVAQSNQERVQKLYKLSSVSEDDFNNSTLAVKSAEADIAYTKAEIDNTEIRAPFNGIIGVRNISPGAFVRPETIIATLYSSGQIKVQFDLPEKSGSQVAVGTPLTFTVQGNSTTYHAKVYVINPGINPETRTLTVRAICNNDGSLRPGSFANISLDLGSDASALLVPSQALVPVLNGQQVYVARNDTAFATPVQTGIRNDTSVQIISGINEGDTVIISGILFLRPKMKIHLKSIK